MHRKVAIIGAGFAGLQACRALRRAPAQITLFDPRDCAVMLPALPDVAGGWIDESLLVRPLAGMLPAGIRHIRRAVTSIDLDRRELTAGDEVFTFDYLLITAGSVTDFHGFDQHRENIFHLDSLESALRIRDAFSAYLRRTDDPHIVMAGGGYTGLELAMSLRERAAADGKECRATVIDPAPEILPFLPPAKRRYIQDVLTAGRIEILNNLRVTGFDGLNVTADPQRFENAFFCWAAGSTFAVPDIQGMVERLRDGRLKVNPDLSLPGYPAVFAAGDSAAFEHNGVILRKAVNFAWYEGKRAGRNIARLLRGGRPRLFRPFDAGWVIPLRRDGIGQLFGRFWIRGRLSLALHYFMCGFRNYRFTNFAGFAKIAAKSLRR